MVQTYMNMFGTNPKLHKSFKSPLEQGYNPDLDTSELLYNEYAHKYKSRTFSLPWYITY